MQQLQKKDCHYLQMKPPIQLQMFQKFKKPRKQILMSAVHDQRAEIHTHTYKEVHNRVTTTKRQNIHIKQIEVPWPNQYLFILNITAAFWCSFPKQKGTNKFAERR